MFAIIRWFAKHPRVLLFIGLLVLFAMVPTWVYLVALGLVVARFVYRTWRRRRLSSARDSRTERRVRQRPAQPPRRLERRKQEGRLRHVG